MQDYLEFIDEVLVDAPGIEKRVRELGEQISQDYEGQDLLVVCLLRGGLTFTADLTRHLSINHELDCMSLSSYGVGHYASSGNVRVNLDLLTNIEGTYVSDPPEDEIEQVTGCSRTSLMEWCVCPTATKSCRVC